MQSLKNLDDPAAIPMVAVRTAGLALGSLVGVCDYSATGGEDQVQSLVSKEYLETLVGLANERFVANKERIGRFEQELFGKLGRSGDWEDADSRRERKRREGLARREASTRGLGDGAGKSFEDEERHAALMDGDTMSPSDFENGV